MGPEQRPHGLEPIHARCLGKLPPGTVPNLLKALRMNEVSSSKGLEEFKENIRRHVETNAAYSHIQCPHCTLGNEEHCLDAEGKQMCTAGGLSGYISKWLQRVIKSHFRMGVSEAALQGLEKLALEEILRLLPDKTIETPKSAFSMGSF